MAWEWGRQGWGSWTDLTPCPPLWKISKVCFFEILIFSPWTLALQSGNSVLAILGPEKIRLCFCSQLDGLCSFPYKKWGCSHERTYMFKKTPQVILSFFSSRVSGASTVHSLVSVFFPNPTKGCYNIIYFVLYQPHYLSNFNDVSTFISHLTTSYNIQHTIYILENEKKYFEDN